jgi:hypothetical protein
MELVVLGPLSPSESRPLLAGLHSEETLRGHKTQRETGTEVDLRKPLFDVRTVDLTELVPCAPRGGGVRSAGPTTAA